MKTLGLILVTFYAALMLFALWKQGTQSTTAADGASPADGSLPGGRELLPSLCIGAGCLLLFAYVLLSIFQRRSMLPLLIIGMLGISAGTLQNGISRKKVHLLHHIIRLIIEAAIAAICWVGMG